MCLCVCVCVCVCVRMLPLASGSGVRGPDVPCSSCIQDGCSDCGAETLLDKQPCQIPRTLPGHATCAHPFKNHTLASALVRAISYRFNDMFTCPGHVGASKDFRVSGLSLHPKPPQPNQKAIVPKHPRKSLLSTLRRERFPWSVLILKPNGLRA